MNVSRITLGSNINTYTIISKIYYLIGIKNYESWKFKMKNILIKNDLYDFFINAPNLVMNEKKMQKISSCKCHE